MKVGRDEEVTTRVSSFLVNLTHGTLNIKMNKSAANYIKLYHYICPFLKMICKNHNLIFRISLEIK